MDKYEVGDEVLVSFDDSGYLAQDDWNHKSGNKKPVRAKIVGFDDGDDSFLIYFNKDIPDGDMFSIDMNDQERKQVDIRYRDSRNKKYKKLNFKEYRFCWIYGNEAIKLVKEDKMSNDDEEVKPPFMNMVKSDATNAAYRVAATQMSKGAKAAVLTLIAKNNFDSEKLKVISELLDTDMGSAFVSYVLGLSLTYTPMISEDSRAKKLASEFRVSGMASIGNTAIASSIEHFLPVIQNVIASLPQEETILSKLTKKPVKKRIASGSRVKLVQEEVEVESEPEPKKRAVNG